MGAADQSARELKRMRLRWKSCSTKPRRPTTNSSFNTTDIERDGYITVQCLRIIKRDLGLKCLKRRHAQELTEANRHARLIRSKQLLQKYSASDVSFIWFTDEKVFTVATPLLRLILSTFTSLSFTEMCVFQIIVRLSDMDISQGSVATHFRCGGIFNDHFIAHLLLSVSVKEFWKLVNIWRRYGQQFGVLFFLTHDVHLGASVRVIMKAGHFRYHSNRLLTCFHTGTTHAACVYIDQQACVIGLSVSIENATCRTHKFECIQNTLRSRLTNPRTCSHDLQWGSVTA